MARAAAAVETPSVWASVRWGRFTFWLVTGALAMIAVLVAWRRTEEFLIKDDRFRIPEAEDIAGPSPNLTTRGVHYASSTQIRHVFADDFGRSLYLVPIQVRRSQLLAIDWVEEATVSKVWPNSLAVDVWERTPIAFVRLPSGAHDGMTQLALIDRDGTILRPRIASRFTLPVIVGLRENEPAVDRRARVHRVLQMLHDIGAKADQISEINAADPNNLIVADHVEGTVVNLMLGDENYADRLNNFLANYSAIRAKRPDSKMLDLRIDGVITAAGGGGNAE